MEKVIPLLSVIVPIYKVEKFLDRCVESLVNQTLKEIEIILVNDGSPDSCPQMCDEWAVKDERIRVIHKVNGGVQSAVIAGVQAAAAEYIGFVDGDDWVKSTMFASLYQTMEYHQADCVRCGICWIDRNGRIHLLQREKENVYCGSEIEQKILAPYWEENLDLMKTWGNSRCDKLYKKEILLKVLPELNAQMWIQEDTELNLLYLPHCEKIVEMQENCDYCYCLNPDSSTKSFSNKTLFGYELCLQTLHAIAKRQNRIGKGLEIGQDRLYFDTLFHVFTGDGNTLSQRVKIIKKILPRIRNRSVIMQNIGQTNFAVYRGMKLLTKDRVKTAVYVYAAMVQIVHRIKRSLNS